MQKVFVFLALTVLLFISCGKDTDVFIPDTETPELRLVGSLFGTVTDELGNPVIGADVWLETHHELTNDLGLFVFRNIEMSSNAYVTVDKQGFFAGSRRFYPTKGNTAQVRIQLLSSDVVGSFQASSGGSITVDGGSRMDFPADAISYPSGEAYSGVVNVAVAPLYTSDPNLIFKMPGDLVGRNEGGQLRALGSFGMIAVELLDNAGSLLQVASGKEVTIEFAIAPDQLSTAPASIPLWYFDEETGYWKEEGEATRSGSSYTMKVGHFSFWNCDAPFPLITLTGSIFYDNGEPAWGVIVCIEVPGLNTSSGGVTDEEGVFTGKVPANEQLILTVKDYNGCEVLEFDEQIIGPFSEDVTIPPITITTTESELILATGSLVDCNGDPVVGGVVEFRFGNTTRYMYLDSTNTFEYSFYNCDQGDVTVVGYDYENNKESIPATMAHAELIEYGPISVCEDLVEYLIMHADGQDITFALPRAFINPQGGGTYIQGTGVQDSSIYFFALVPGEGIGTFLIDGINGGGEVFFDLGFGNGGRINPAEFVFTYYGDVGDFIIGTVSGTYIELDWSSGQVEEMPYPFTGEFKIYRE